MQRQVLGSRSQQGINTPVKRKLSWSNDDLTGSDMVIPGVDVHAVLYNVSEYDGMSGSHNGKPYCSDVKYVITTDENTWIKILKSGIKTANLFVHGFLHVATKGYNKGDYQDLNSLYVKPDAVETGAWQNTDADSEYMHIYSNTSFDNTVHILPFLKALYSISNPSKPAVNLPQQWIEAPGADFSLMFDGLNEFIAKYQTVLISDLSLKSDLIATPGIENVIEQTNNTRDMRTAYTMADSAYASACAAAKQAVVDVVDNGLGKYDSSTASSMVKNSAIIIKYALGKAKTLNESENARKAAIIGSLIDLAFVAIPGERVLTKLLLEGLKTACKSSVNEVFSSDAGSLIVYGQKLASAFNKLPQKFAPYLANDSLLSDGQKERIASIMDDMVSNFVDLIY